MKDCSKCRFLDTGYYGEGLCTAFNPHGCDEIPEWSENGDGCHLRYQEAKKLQELVWKVIDDNYAYPTKEYDGGKNIRTEEEQEIVDKHYSDYRCYLKELERRCREREDEREVKEYNDGFFGR